MSRKYTKKKLDYWVNRKVHAQPQSNINLQTDNTYGGEFSEDGHYSALAACGGGDSASRTFRGNNAPTIEATNRYKNIRDGIVPFEESGGLQSIATALDAVYRAYFNVQILRNCINMMVDFSSSPLHVRTSNKTVKKFFEDWFEAINLPQLLSEYFLEYYRTGNVFLYKFSGKVQDGDFEKLKEAFAAKEPIIPIKYIVLNPMQVGLQHGIGFSKNYVKILSNFEIERLKYPKTPEDQQVFDSLPPAEQKRIKSGSSFNDIYIPLDPDRLFYVFYKKQNYEPFAIPPTYGILNDIEWKLELKKMDLTLSRTIEQVILLVTAGAPADQYNKGLNQKHLEKLQSIFKNQTIGRVLVADYTTKAEWVIPDLKELLGPEKYDRVDKDIKEGLQYMFFGDEKFANATIKIKVFIETLKEGRKAFLNNFLIPEAKKVGLNMNFKNLPKFEFEEINLQDEALMNKIYVQMAQLGLLTPDELNNALTTGILPTKEISETNQAEYKTQRKNDLYVPLLGGSEKQDEAGRPGGSKAPQTTKKVGPIGTTSAKFGVTKIAENMMNMQKIRDALVKAAKKKWKIKELSESQNLVMDTLAKAILVNEKQEDYVKSSAAYLAKPVPVNDEIQKKIDEICVEYDVDSSIASVLYKSSIETSV